MSIGLVMAAVILASAVEMVEAMTILLASGTTRGWKSTLEGAFVALVALVLIAVIAGPSLVNYVPIHTLQLVVGTLLLIFGLQWLRKAILRSSGHKALHDEDEIFRRESASLAQAPGSAKGRRDPIAFAVSFKGVFLEGLEVMVIVIMFGAPTGHLVAASAAAIGAAIVVGVIGAILARPLSRVPENSMKMAVGLLLSAFGAFWLGEGVGVEWPGADWAVLAILAGLSVLAFCLIRILQRSNPRAV